MSIDQSGFGKVQAKNILVEIAEGHPLVRLANVLPWESMVETVMLDLKKTEKSRWWMGRPLRLRIHLGAYLLQQILRLTDRQTEYGCRDNAAYQLFCGKFLVQKWHSPDHTKIESFRSRLTVETQQKLTNIIANHAVHCGFADASHIDIDSTVQEANMSYPADSHLLCKLGSFAKKVADYMNEKISAFKFKPMMVDMKGIKARARKYFFKKPQTDQAKKNELLSDLLNYVEKETRLIIDNGRCMGQRFVDEMPWNIRRVFLQLIEKSRKYLRDVRSFINTGRMVKGKILSFHLNEVFCITKNKPGKKYQFGRIFQLGRIRGNFFFVGKNDVPNQADKKAVEMMLQTHTQTFDDKTIDSVATDKGYYSWKNEKLMLKHGVKEIGIQRPNNIKRERVSPLSTIREDELINRRAGIEPLIGHAKNRSQLGRSKMKSDRTIEASGFASVLGFNLRQLIRYETGKISLGVT